jgi:hypothetical protein
MLAASGINFRVLDLGLIDPTVTSVRFQFAFPDFPNI